MSLLDSSILVRGILASINRNKEYNREYTQRTDAKNRFENQNKVLSKLLKATTLALATRRHRMEKSDSQNLDMISLLTSFGLSTESAKFLAEEYRDTHESL